MNILLLEAYYGGSHKLWADQLKEYSSHSIDILSLPARHWKWRMEGAAFEFIKQLKTYPRIPDLIIGTSMMDLSFLKSNLPEGWSKIPCIYYMHENQLSYPKSSEDKDQKVGRDFHYGMIQCKSMLSSNNTCFNSSYHKTDFFDHLDELMRRLPDFTPIEQIEKIKNESVVLPVGIIDTRRERKSNKTKTILWNHRWEYDKNPSTFFKALIALKASHDFNLIVLGSKARVYPKIFDEAKMALADRIVHWGFAESQERYYELLNQADLLPVSSHQDFFGISIMESVLAGAIPILPNRLVYPEHFNPNEHTNLFYDSDHEFIDLLKERLTHPIEEKQKNALINKAKEYLWSEQIINYDHFFESQIL